MIYTITLYKPLSKSQNLISRMKATLILLALACTLAVVYGDLVCGTNYCKQHPCSSPVARTSCRNPSTYRANHAGKCACCPACVTFLSE